MTEQQPTGVPAPGPSEPEATAAAAPATAEAATAEAAATAAAAAQAAAPATPEPAVPAVPAVPADPTVAIATPAQAAPVPADAAVPAAATAAVVAAAQAPAPPAPPATKRRKRDRALGTTGQVFGIVGMIVSIALIVGVVLGRGYAVQTVNDVAANIDAQIAKVSPILVQAHTTVGEVSGKVGTVADIAAGIAADPNPGGQIADTLRAAVASVNEKYQVLRQGYAGIRETALSIIDKLQTLDRLIPGLTIPEGPIDALNTFDTNLQAFDAKVNDLLTIEPGTGPANQAAARIAEAATGIEDKLQAVQDGITMVDDRVTQLRTDITNTANTVNLIITLVTVFIVLLLLYILLLHWVLFRHSGETRRKVVAA